MSDPQNILTLIARLIGFATLLQSLEFIKIKDSISKEGIWRWHEMRSEYSFLPKRVALFLDWVMEEKHFIEMMTMRFYLSLLAIIYPYFLPIFLVLFFTTFLITLRWRGSFNGGSDYLTLIILLCLCVGFIHPLLAKGALCYMSLQVISSYFLAGLYKIKQIKWRIGSAIYGFVSSPNYKTPAFVLKISLDPQIAKIMAWSVITFELSFPLVLTHPFITKAYLFGGVIFHLGNFMIFGLNRFFWVWCASYPALYYCAQLI